jgi:hypothetical protein
MAERRGRQTYSKVDCVAWGDGEFIDLCPAVWDPLIPSPGVLLNYAALDSNFSDGASLDQISWIVPAVDPNPLSALYTS